jgi:histidine ammonia-lyase
MRLTRADLGRVRRSRAVIERLIARGETAYGVNTGFGSLASERISTPISPVAAQPGALARRRHRCTALG